MAALAALLAVVAVVDPPVNATHKLLFLDETVLDASGLRGGAHLELQVGCRARQFDPEAPDPLPRSDLTLPPD